MEIREFFREDKAAQAHWIEEIQKSDWRAAGFLVHLLTENKFEEMVGNGQLLLLTDGDKLASFVTFAEKDCIADESLFPWVGFVFTFPEYRGRRCAGILIERCAELARSQGCKKLWVNTDHIGLYEKYGFVYKENRSDIWGEDSRIYYREL